MENSLVRTSLPLASAPPSRLFTSTSSLSNLQINCGSLFAPLELGKCSIISFAERGRNDILLLISLSGMTGTLSSLLELSSSLCVLMTPVHLSIPTLLNLERPHHVCNGYGQVACSPVSPLRRPFPSWNHLPQISGARTSPHFCPCSYASKSTEMTSMSQNH